MIQVVATTARFVGERASDIITIMKKIHIIALYLFGIIVSVSLGIIAFQLLEIGENLQRTNRDLDRISTGLSNIDFTLSRNIDSTLSRIRDLLRNM